MSNAVNEPIESRDDGRFSSVLVPVDGSPESELAIESAAQFDVDRIVLLRVEPDDPEGGDAPSNDAYARWRRDHLAAVRDDMAELARDHAAAATSVDPLIRYGNAAQEIIAEALDHDLVVMSSSGKGAAGRFLFGSVADRVTRHGATPTLVVRAGRDGVSLGPAQRVVVPIDGSQLAERALPMASRIARMLPGPIHLVRCVGMDEVLQTAREARAEGDGLLYGTGDDPYEKARERTDEIAQRYLEEVRDRLEAEGLIVTIERLGGTAVFELLRFVTGSDLVVMTSRGQGGYRRWMLGSVAEKMVREAKAPVLLVPIGRAGDNGDNADR